MPASPKSLGQLLMLLKGLRFSVLIGSGPWGLSFSAPAAKLSIKILLSTRVAAVGNSDLYMSASSLIVADRRKGLHVRPNGSRVKRYVISSIVIPVLILGNAIPKEPRQVALPFIENQLQACLPNIAYDPYWIQSESQQCRKNFRK